MIALTEIKSRNYCYGESDFFCKKILLFESLSCIKTRIFENYFYESV